MSPDPHLYMLYARVSPKGSDWSAEETSISMQISEMQSYILHKDPAAKFVIRQDEFRSGKDLNRPGLQAIIADLQTKCCQWSTLVVWALDRLSRSLADAVPLIEQLRDAGCGFICIRQDYLSTQGAMARFTLNQTILIAQLEREMTSERVKAKMVHIAEQGKYPAGKLPLGYRRKDGKKNEIEPDPVTAPIVQQIFSAYLSGTETVVQIRKRYAEHLTDKNQFYRLLKNRLYIGEIEYDGKIYPGKHEPIIDRALFDAVQKSVVHCRTAPRPRRQKYEYLLQGLITCHCGKKMTPYSVTKKNGKRYYYYKCQDTLNCKKAVNAEKLDQDVINSIRSLILDPEYISDRLEAWKDHRRQQIAANDKRMQESSARIAEQEKELTNIEKLFLSGIVTPENAAYWNAKLSEIRHALENTRRDHSALESSLSAPSFPEPTIEEILAQLKQWSDELDHADNFQTKRNLALMVVQEILLDASGEINMSLVMTKCYKWRSEWDLLITATVRRCA